MSRQYTDEERAKARERMRRLREDPEYAQRNRDAARERMRRLRSNPEYVQREQETNRERRRQPEYVQRDREAARERMRRLRSNPEYVQRDREAARERMRRLRRSSSAYNARELQRNRLARSDMSNAIGNRPYKCVYDSWYTLRRRALQAGELEETIITLDQWVSIVDHYGGICLCCGEANELTFDHVLPISMGGTFTVDNIQPLCLPCNLAKRNRHIDYRPDAGAFGQSLGSFDLRL